MKKLSIIIFLEILLLSCSPINNCNSNDTMNQGFILENILLNETEGAYLNVIFQATRKDFDFKNKKIGFITGSSGGTKSSKELYFDMQRRYSNNKNYPCNDGTLYIFDASQKAESGGYDAAILYWCKFILPVEKVIKNLKDKH